MTVADDVRAEDGGDGECMGRPSLIRCSGWTKTTDADLLEIFPRKDDDGGRGDGEVSGGGGSVARWREEGEQGGEEGDD